MSLSGAATLKACHVAFVKKLGYVMLSSFVQPPPSALISQYTE